MATVNTPRPSPHLSWLDRASSSVRRQYTVTLVASMLMLVLLAVICAASVIAASVFMGKLNDEAVPLQTANKSVMQDMTDAETGIRGYALTGSTGPRAPYIVAMGYLPSDKIRLAELARPYPDLAEAVAVQEEAISDWITSYAQPVAESSSGEVKAVERGLSPQGAELFQRIRSANYDVDVEIDHVTTDISDRSRSVVFWTLAAVVLLPLLMVILGSVAARRMRQALVDPLDDVLEVLQRLREGDLSARAEEAGPEEIREIAAALNVLAEENLRGRDVEVDVLNRLEEIDRVRTELVSTVSHELRTPLTSIKGYLELLQDQLSGQLTDSQAAMLAVVRRNLERLNELITNLLALSRAEETQLSVEPIDLRGVAAEVAGDVRMTAASRDITVKTIQSASPVVMLGDRSQLIRAVLNLCSNAVKFSKPGDTVEIRVLHQGGEAVIEVVDEGIGIPAADLPDIGSRFYRASNAMRAEIAGTGLGLRIVQTIVDRHEGTLSVESVEGEGTTATIRLPLTRAIPESLALTPETVKALARD